MFLHIATNMKDMDKVKAEFEKASNVNMDDYQKEIYNLSDILIGETKDKEKLLNKMYKSLLIGRNNNISVMLFFDEVEDIKLIDKNGIVRNNCFILEKNNYYNSINNLIMSILLTQDEEEINKKLNRNGFTAQILFSVNNLENGKYDVTLGFNSMGEDVCSKELSSHLEAYRFAAIRTILGYDIISY